MLSLRFFMFKHIFCVIFFFFFFSSRRRHTRLQGDWSSDVCSSDLRRHGSFPVRLGCARRGDLQHRHLRPGAPPPPYRCEGKGVHRGAFRRGRGGSGDPGAVVGRLAPHPANSVSIQPERPLMTAPAMPPATPAPALPPVPLSPWWTYIDCKPSRPGPKKRLKTSWPEPAKIPERRPMTLISIRIDASL